MARGWESKSVESQVDDRRIAEEQKRGRTAAEELEHEHRRHGLEMSRRRIVSELQTTQSHLRRPSLEAALKHLDTEIKKLDSQ
ncbi:MAG TPA: hypothetical protein VKH35_00345 [Thermoanaerobaculia bacterium]|nr:hypothetical protein [Thermoanaerobaculia bacterium]